MNLNNDANAEIIGKKTETHDQENFETVNISSFMKLCDFQVKIKEENIFKELQASKINEFTEQMQSLSKEIIFKRKKILGFHRFSLKDKFNASESKAGNLRSFLEESLIETVNLTHPQSKCFFEIFAALHINYKVLSSIILEYIKKNSKMIDFLTFSTIPGLFGALWNNEYIDKYINFVVIMSKFNLEVAATFARTLFVIPEFSTFLDRVVSSCTKSPTAIETYEHSEKYVAEFMCRIEDNKEYCPLYVKKLLLAIPDEKDRTTFLYNALLKELSQRPNVYGLIENSFCEKNSLSKLSKSFLDHTTSIVEQFLSIDESNENSSKLICNDGTVAFTPKDIKILRAMMQIADKMNYFSINCSVIEELQLIDNYKIFILQFQVSKKVPRRSTQSECTETFSLPEALEDILISIDPLPKDSSLFHDNDNIFAVLDKQKKRTCKFNRLSVEMKVDSLHERFEDELSKMSLDEVINVLTERFESRKDTRIAMLEEISNFQYQNAKLIYKSNELNIIMQNKKDIIRFLYVGHWVISHKISKVLTNKRTIEQFCKDNKAFTKYFSETYNKCAEWCTLVGCGTNSVDLILHDILMTKIPISTFVKFYPEFLNEDNSIYNKIAAEGANPLVYILGSNEAERKKTRKDLGNILDHPEIIKRAVQPLEITTQVGQPIQKAKMIIKSLTTLRNIYQNEKSIPGEDEMQPLRIFLLSISKQFNSAYSTIKYIKHFTETLFENQEIKDIVESMELTNFENTLGLFK